jgi:hypothetical protein
MDQVTYNVDVAARKTSIGWELTLDNGRDLQVTTLDDAAARVRTLLDIHQPQVDHGKVTVNLVIPPVISNDQDAPTPEATPRGCACRERVDQGRVGAASCADTVTSRVEASRDHPDPHYSRTIRQKQQSAGALGAGVHAVAGSGPGEDTGLRRGGHRCLPLDR